MLEPALEYASDLEWMLQSGQASRAVLAEALVREFYPALYRLVYATLIDQTAAQGVTRHIFIAALNEVYRYRSTQGVRHWFFSIALRELRRAARWNGLYRWLETVFPFLEQWVTSDGPLVVPAGAEAALWQAFVNLKLRARWLFVLKFGLAWPDGDSARLLGVTEAKLLQLVDETLGQLNDSNIEPEAGAAASISLLTGRIIATLESRCALADLSETNGDWFVGQLLDGAEGVSRRRARFAYSGEIALTGIIILLVLALIWGMNRWFVDPEVETGPEPTRRIAAGTAPTPTPGPRFRPVPIDALYTVQPGDTLTGVARSQQVSLETLRLFNRLSVEPVLKPGECLLLPGRLDPLDFGAPQYGLIEKPAPLPSEPTSAEIASFVQPYYFASAPFWIDATLIDYGLQGFGGPAQIYRFQVWMGGQYTLALTGPLQGNPEEVLLYASRRSFLALPAAGQPWFIEMDWWGRIREYEVSTRLRQMFQTFDTYSQANGDLQFTLIRKDAVAGRPAWKVRLSDRLGEKLALLWLDAEFGFPLRRQNFQPGAPDLAIYEFRVDRFVYPVDLPLESLFDPRFPWRGGYAADASGSPLANDRTGLLPTCEAPPEANGGV